MHIKFLRQKPDTFDYNAPRTCLTCGSSFSGKYCNVCGEKVLEPSDKSLRNFFGGILNALTFIDNKFFYTLRLMLTRTGYVTSQYIKGVRVPFIRPLSMFFVVNLIYFLCGTGDTFNSSLIAQMNYFPHKRIATTAVTEHIERDKITLEEFTLQYNRQSTSIAKMLLIVFVMLAAVPFMLLNYTRERYFVDHLMTSLEFCSVIILISLILLPWLIIFLGAIFQFSIKTILNDRIYTIIAALICFLFLCLMERRVYGQRYLLAVVKAIVLVPCLFYVLQAYRIILFFVTMWTL